MKKKLLSISGLHFFIIQGLLSQSIDTISVLKLFVRIDSIVSKGDLDSASSQLKGLLKLPELQPESAKSSIAGSLSTTGSLWMKAYRFNEAETCFELSRKMYVKLYGDTNDYVEGVLKNLGGVAWRQTKHATSLLYFEECLRIDKELYGDESDKVAKMYNNIGVVQSDLGWFDEAIQCLEKSLAIKKKIYGENHPSLVVTLLNIGALYNEKNDPLRAITNFLLAKELAEKTLPTNDQNFGKLFSNLASTFMILRDYGNAIGYHEKGIAAKILAYGEKSPEVADSYSNISGVYAEIGDLAKAEMYAQKAFLLRREIFEPNHISFGFSYSHLANVYVLQKNWVKALDADLKSAEIIENSLGRDNTYLSEIYFNTGVQYNQLGEYGKALEYYGKSLELSLKIGGVNNYEVIRTKGDIAEVYNKLGKPEQALEYIEELEKNAYFDLFEAEPEKVIAHTFLLDALVMKAKLLQMQGSLTGSNETLDKAAKTYLSALSLMLFIRKNFHEESSKQNLSSNKKGLFEGLIGFGINHKIPGKNAQFLFELSEQSKSLLLLEAVKNSSALSFGGIPRELLDKEYDMKVAVNYLKKRIYEEENREEGSNDSLVFALKATLFDRKKEYEALTQQFEENYKQYFNLKYQDKVTGVADLQNTLLSPGQTLLEFFTGDSSIFVFVVKKDDYQIHEIIKDFPLETWVDSLRKLILRPSFSPNAYVEMAASLYDKILRPVEHLLTDSSLIIIPDGALGYLPFDALLTERPKNPKDYPNHPYLLRKHAISYCYSATLLQLMQEKQHSQPPAAELLAFAPWTGGKKSSDFRSGADHPDSLGMLAHSGEEVDFITQLTGGDAWYDGDATKSRFTQIAANYRTLFLSLHGKADNRVGDYSWLAFYNGRNGLDSTLLYVRDLYNLQLNADMVVLSACETSIGELQRGEGIISLARAFAYAGAKSIVSTLWQVNDKTTSGITQDFFKQLKDNKMRKDEALRQAKLDDISRKNFCQPYYWSGLIPVGDMGRVW